MTYPRRVKEEILRRIEKGEIVRKISEETNIPTQTIYKWEKQTKHTYVPPKNNIKAQEDEIKKVRKSRKTVTKEDKLEILKLKAKGYDNKEISQMLDKSIDTINKYSIIYAKKGYFDKQEADKIKKARRLGIDINKSILDDIENSYIIKDLKDEQINLYIGKKQEKVADEITRQEMRELEEIKREITVEVNYDKEPNKEKEEKIRQYIETCNRIYENKKLPKLELQFLEKAIKKVPSSYKDIVRFTKKCINMGLFVTALEMVMQTEDMEKLSITKQEKERLKNTQSALFKICQIQEAIFTIRRGNTNSEVISKVLGLPKEEIDILKIKISDEPTKFLKPEKREEIIGWLLLERDPDIMKQELGISDFEMEDIKNQSRYRDISSRRTNIKKQIRQDTYVRMVVMFTKLGMSESEISNILNIDTKQVNENIKLGKEAELIKKEQINGIDILKPQEINKFEEMER